MSTDANGAHADVVMRAVMPTDVLELVLSVHTLVVVSTSALWSAAKTVKSAWSVSQAWNQAALQVTTTFRDLS